MFHRVFHCAFHCVTQRRARFTARFTAFHSAARISLQPKVCRGKFPISNAIKSGPVNLQLVCENHPSLERKACKRLTTSLLAQHYETLLRDGLRCRCLIITSNSNSVFSSRASCQNQAHQLGPPQYRNGSYLMVVGIAFQECQHFHRTQAGMSECKGVRVACNLPVAKLTTISSSDFLTILPWAVRYVWVIGWRPQPRGQKRIQSRNCRKGWNTNGKTELSIHNKVG